MKQVKASSLFAVAVGVLLALAATASATTITSSEGGTPWITAETEGHAVLDNPIAKIECQSRFGGIVQSHGAGVPAEGNTIEFSFTGCTNSWHVTTVFTGWFSIEGTGGGNGKLKSESATIEATRFGISCRYATGLFGTTIGTITGGSFPTIDINGALPFHSGSIFCGTGATTWTGSYRVIFPFSLSVD